MLSRVAHSLYWMARYIERAENVARILDVNLQSFLEFANRDDDDRHDRWLPIVRATGDLEVFRTHHQIGRASCRERV